MLISKESNKNKLLFIAGFHLGIPLQIFKTKNILDWKYFTAKFSKFLQSNNRFQISSIYDNTISFPLAKPIIIIDKLLKKEFNIIYFFESKGYKFKKDEIKFENKILIYPSGVVSIIGIIEFANKYNEFEFNNLSKDFEIIIGEKYAELTAIYLRVADIVYNILSKKELKRSYLCCYRDIEAVGKLTNVEINIYNRTEFEDILIDVYFIKQFISDKTTTPNITYIRSELNTNDSTFIHLIILSHSTFIEFIWILKYLSEKIRILQDILVKQSESKSKISNDLKIFRIFCINFINESRPISIRITEGYLVCMETFWEKERLHKLEEQVNEQVNAIENMFDWIEQKKNESRNFKIGISAIIFSLLSISSVVASLISTIDFETNNYMFGFKQRIIIILIFSFAGIFITLASFIPFKKIFKK